MTRPNPVDDALKAADPDNGVGRVVPPIRYGPAEEASQEGSTEPSCSMQDERFRARGEALLPAVLADPNGLRGLQMLVGAYALGGSGDWHEGTEPEYVEYETEALGGVLEATNKAVELAGKTATDLAEALAKIDRLEQSIRAAGAILEDPYDKP